MCDCGKEHETINQKLDDLHQTMEFHTAEVHGTLVSRSEIEESDEQIRTAILGPIKPYGLHAGERDKRNGIEWKVDELWKMTQNGGIHAKFSNADKVALWGPTVTAIGVVLAAFFGVFS